MRKTYIAVLIAALIAALAMAGSAQAAPPYQYTTVSGAACKPAGKASTNPGTEFAAKAIGGRNEGTTNSIFVICPMISTPTPAEGGVMTEASLVSYAIDGKPHSMDCTAVIGSLNRYIPNTYSVKTIAVPGNTDGIVTTWNAADFGGTGGEGIPGSAWISITCLAPPQTGIGLFYAKLNQAM